MESNTGQIINLGSLYNRLERLPDKRKAKGKRYALATILVGMFLAKLSGEGKILRGTIDLEVSHGLCLLALYLPGEGITLDQVAIENKQSEVSATPTLLGWVDLRNKVVIGDALHTQRQVSIQIGKAGGHYVWTVKGNHPQLLQDLQDWFDPTVPLLPGMGCPPKDFRSATITHKGHGRLEVRALTTSSQLNDFLDWPFLQQVFQLKRTVTISKTGKTHHETIYGVTSLSAEQTSASQLLNMRVLIGRLRVVFTTPVMSLCTKTRPASRTALLLTTWLSLTIWFSL